MGKITLTIFSLLLSGSLAFGQSQRMVLAEELTSATCPPCASQNPAFNALLQANTDIVTSIKYQMNWPTPNGDPMYLDNPEDNNARRSYYGVNAIPWVFLDGGFDNQPQFIYQSTLDAAAGIPSPFEIQIQHYVTPDQDSIYLTMLIEVTDDVSGNLVAHDVVIEKEIHFSSPPGTTNEKDFYNVMKKMLPSSNGTVLASSYEVGDYVILQDAWLLANIYDMDELAAVGFVQDNTSKDVFQSANSSTDAIEAVYSLDAEVLSVSNVPSASCAGEIVPFVKIRNNGSEALTQLTINYSVNGGEEHTYGWSGNLDFLEMDEFELSDLSFSVEETNNLVIEGVEPNGSTDDYPTNNTLVYEIDEAATVSGNSILFFILDDNPEEITWEVLNSNGEVVQEGGPYTTSGPKSEPLAVSANGCYEFIIYDESGSSSTYYALVYGNNQKAFESTGFGAYERNEFAYDIVGVGEPQKITDLQLYPNPATDKLNIKLFMPVQSEITIRVSDILGKTVYEDMPGKTSAGSRQYVINTSDFQSGLYLLQVEASNEVIVKKFNIK